VVASLSSDWITRSNSTRVAYNVDLKHEAITSPYLAINQGQILVRRQAVASAPGYLSQIVT
jgi:hypothetical protein